jgi:hypothetical protein
MAFHDVNSGDWFYKDVNDLVAKGIINGYPDGTFKPNSNVAVDEFIKMFVISVDSKLDYGKNDGYWATPYINKAKELKIVKDDDFDSYKRPINRAEMAMIAVRSLPDTKFAINLDKYSTIIKDFNETQDKFKDYVLKAYTKGIMAGDDYIMVKPNDNAKRSEASAIIMRALYKDRRQAPYQFKGNTYKFYYDGIKIKVNQKEMMWLSPDERPYYDADGGIQVHAKKFM